MSGPIVRSGPTPEYSSNWAAAFGGKKAAKSKAESKPAKKKTAKKKTAKKKKKKA